MQNRKLYRSNKDRIFAGVIGGLADYLNTDPNLLRLIWSILTLFTGLVPGILIYLLAAVILPEQPVTRTRIQG